MIIKLLCTFDFNPETNEYKPIGDPEVVKSTKKQSITEESSEPHLILLDNKYSLNSAALELLGVTAGDKIDIRYQIIENINYPIIGSSTSWKSTSGNKLTKSSTVSYRGKANEMLSTFGDTFDLTSWTGHDGLFILIGNKEQVIDPNIEVKTDNSVEIDKPIEATTEEDDSLDEFLNDDKSQDNFELSNFKFKF